MPSICVVYVGRILVNIMYSSYCYTCLSLPKMNSDAIPDPDVLFKLPSLSPFLALHFPFLHHVMFIKSSK